MYQSLPDISEAYIRIDVAHPGIKPYAADLIDMHVYRTHRPMDVKTEVSTAQLSPKTHREHVAIMS